MCLNQSLIRYEETNMAAATTMIDVRIDENVKAPNASSRAAIVEASEIIQGRRARFSTAAALIDDIEKTSVKQASKPDVSV
jgi:hypothetical protein